MSLNRNHKVSETLSNFNSFLKKRNQKQNILICQSKSVLQKVCSFEQLLKLTKTGSTVSKLEISGQQSKVSYKQFATCKLITDIEKQQKNRIQQNTDNTEELITKFCKMTNELHKWEISKKNSKHESAAVFNKQKKDKNNLSVQQYRKNKINHRNVNTYLTNSVLQVSTVVSPQSIKMDQNEDKYLINGINYPPIKKRSIRTCANKMARTIRRQQFQKTTKEAFLIEEENKKLKKLKRNIEDLEENALTKYGITFQMFQNIQQEPTLLPVQNSIFDKCAQLRQRLFLIKQQKQNREQLSGISSSDMRIQNSSIPACLLLNLPTRNFNKSTLKYQLKTNNYIRIT